MNDLGRMRVSDAEREHVVAHLQHATTEGRLSLDELGDRVSAAYAARTWVELEQVVEDLPTPVPPAADEPPEAAPESEISNGLLAALVVAMGLAAVPISFSSPLGPVLGVIAVVLGVLTLSMRREMSPVSRGIVLTGVGLGLLPPVFYLSLLLLLGS
jgi:hypothetical protein